VLLVLLGFSLFSWAIIFQKYRLFARIERQTQKFLQMFRTSRALPEPKTLDMATRGSPLVSVYAAGYRELQSQLAAGNPHGQKLKNPNAVAVEMQLTAAEEVRKLEHWMPWLATTGSVTPFIGLFGTVWGVMDAFAGLGIAGAASLRVVAPGIAEALITTAAGLFTAIPAVIAYNHYLHDIKDLGNRMDNFVMEFVLQVEMPQLSRQTGTSLADINIVPFVDVVLVLLVIFMITAPILQSGIEVDLPKTKTVKEIAEERLVITIDRAQRLYLGNDPVNIHELGALIRSRSRDPEHQAVFVRCDETVPFGSFATVVDQLRQSGIQNVSVVTEPISERPRIH